VPSQSLATPSHSTAASATSSSTTVARDPAQDAIGNAAVQDQLAGKSAGQLSWEAALGETLGAKLYDAISDKLSDAELRSAAEKAVASATGKLDSFLKGQADASEHDAAAALVRALDGEIKRIAGNAVTGEVGAFIRDYVDENPLVIASAAVAAAVAYVLSNQKIGMVDGKVKLGGGHSVIGGVDLGRTMDIAVEQVRVGYRYQSGQNKAELVADYFSDDGSYKVSGRYDRQLGPNERLSLSGVQLERDDLSRTRLDLGYSSDHLGMGAWWQRDRELGGDVDTFGGQVTAKGEDWSAYARGQASTDGSWRGASGIEQKRGDLSWGVEGFTGRDAYGKRDSGVQAVFKWRF